jgi:hypothetical protein
MKGIRRPGRFRQLLGIGAVASAAALLGAAVPALAAAGSAPVTYYACVTAKTGTIKIVSRTARCDAGQYRISWNNTGPQGARGAAGPAGPQGPAGVVKGYWSNSYEQTIQLGTNPGSEIVSVQPPAGNYLIMADAWVQIDGASTSDQVLCYVNVQGQAIFAEGAATLTPDAAAGVGSATIPVDMGATIPAGTTISLWCFDENGVAFVGNSSILAIPVAALNPAGTASDGVPPDTLWGRETEH